MGTLHRFQLDNGIRVIVEPAESRSVAVTLLLGRGSRHEPAELGGATHFLEHMLFKGTSRRDVFQLARDINLLGGGLDASTGTDSIRLTNRVVPGDLADALAMMAEMLWESLLPPAEVERERGVILEEIAECRDAPEDACWEAFQARLWLPHPLGRPILGEPERIGGLGRDDLASYWEEILDPTAIVLSMAGAVTPEGARLLAEEVFGNRPRSREPRALDGGAATATAPGRVWEERDLEQVQFCLGSSAPGRHDPKRYALALLDLVLGGGMGSRLFNEVRERRGLVYTIGSTATLHQREACLSVFGSTSPERLAQVLELVKAEARKLAESGPTDEELETARRMAERSYLLALEGVGYLAGRNGARELYGELHQTDEDLLAKLRAVTVDDVRDLAAEVLGGREMTESLVGPAAGG